MNEVSEIETSRVSRETSGNRLGFVNDRGGGLVRETSDIDGKNPRCNLRVTMSTTI